MTTTANYLLSQKPDDEEMTVAHWARTEFNLPPSIVQLCDIHFLRVWDGEFVIATAKNGVICTAGAEWTVHWQSTREVCKSAEKVACSFRLYRGKKYVVVKVWK